MNYAELDALFAAIGEHHVSARAVVGRVERKMREHAPEASEQVSVTALTRRPVRRDRGAVGVHVEGLDDVMVRLSRCCTPVPPDEIMGFVTRGRGVSVHRADCANAVSLSSGQPDRLIDVEWDEQTASHFVATFEVKALDRPLLLRDVVDVLAEHRVNVLSTSTATSGSDRVAGRCAVECTASATASGNQERARRSSRDAACTLRTPPSSFTRRARRVGPRPGMPSRTEPVIRRERSWRW
jgi:GTP pyrophosphokinase